MMIAYYGNPSVKSAVLAQLKAHYDADEIIKGIYWENGKGCAVGCTIHSGEHRKYESRFGIPQMLAHLEDLIFEGLPHGSAKMWPIRFMSAIRPGADLSRVGWQFLHWLLTDDKVNPGNTHPLVRDAIEQCAAVLIPLTKGEPVDAGAAWRAVDTANTAWGAANAKSAAIATWSAAWSATRSAEGAATAAWNAARSAAGAARNAARSAAEDAENASWGAARSAAIAAESAAEGAESASWGAENASWGAAIAAWGAAYELMADKLIELIEAV